MGSPTRKGGLHRHMGMALRDRNTFGQNQALPVTDFYDFGGGFYFTLLPGRKGALIRITKDTGWLIGEAVLDAAALEGKIEFHPYAEMSGMPGGAEASRPVLQNWAPRLIKP